VFVVKFIVALFTDLSRTLKDATEVAKAYREDLSVLRQIAESQGPLPTQGSEPESIIPKDKAPQSAEFPRHPLDWYVGRPTRLIEDDAPPEAPSDVDVTATEEELIEAESEESAINLEAQERLKAQLKESDMARLRENAQGNV
jgi:hypothetical protein